MKNLSTGFRLPVWSAKCSGDRTNCEYPDANIATDAESFKKYVSTDHTFICFNNNYRNEANFLYTDVLVTDCDNDHSDDPNDWITKEDIIDNFSDVAMLLYTSRNHMKPKDGKSPRPKYHVVFFVERITNAKDFKRLMGKVQQFFPYFDKNAQDAARFFFGNPDTEVYVQPGLINLSMFFDEDSFAKMGFEIKEGNRNSTMFKIAMRSMKRYGNTDKTKEFFYQQAEKCSPPLEEWELESIWRSASKYYKKIAASPDYIAPNVYNASGDIIWEDPIPFSKYTKVRFPVEAFPDTFAEYISAVSESTQTPIDMAGSVALSILSVCLQGKYIIQGKKDWIEPLNTYVLVVASPSERKSAVLKLMLEPVNKYEIQYNTKNSALFEGSKFDKRVLERKLKTIESLVAKGKADTEEKERIVQELTDFKEITPLRLYVDDITTERLVSVMSANNGRAAIISSEGGIFDTLSGIYTKNVNIDVMLKGYSGDTIRVDRVGRQSECVVNSALTILLMAQPSVISDVLSNKTFRGRGLTSRFLYCMPISKVGTRTFNSDTIPLKVYRDYELSINDMLDSEYPEEPHVITLSEEAELALIAFADEIEPKIVKEYSEVADWVGKLIGNILRIAGLLCRAGTPCRNEFLDTQQELIVDEDTMLNAIKLGRYFLNSTKDVYSVMPEITMVKKALRILQMIKEKNLNEFDRRTAMRYCRSFKTVNEIQPVLDFLDDYGYLALKPANLVYTGRPPLPKYSVNPYVHSDLCLTVTQESTLINSMLSINR